MDETGMVSAPTETVTRFLNLLAGGDVDAACDLLADDVRYVNVSLPEVRGQDRVRRIFRQFMGRKGVGLEVYVHRIGLDRGSVLTERTDVLIFGPVRVQVWVWGRFDVADGRIVVWKDYFDWWDAAVATVRGLLGVVFPSLAASPPAD
ncbi:MAG: nuclear transport factor 2 family protein [Acidimicrobiaceae bacterium]|nr:nuclear transport factor 2 family protein [Acidimicrobiaceae bacterium]